MRNFSKNMIFAFGILAITFLIGCQKTESIKSEGQEAIPVKIIKVELRDLDELLEYVGDIKAQDEAIIYSKVSGKIIEKLKIDSDPVTKGEAIAYIDRDEVGLKFEKAPVESSLEGVIGRIYVDIGENVTTQTPVVLVVNIDKVKINLDIPEKYLPKVSQGQQAKVYIDAQPEDEFIGTVTKISPVLDLVTRSAPIEIFLDNPQHKLKPGMFAKVKLAIQKYNKVPVVLKESVMGKEPGNYIYVIENNVAVLKKVVLGIRKESYVQVLEGVKEGEKVVIMGQQRLKDGSLVAAEE